MHATPYRIAVASSSPSLVKFMVLALRVAGYVSYAVAPSADDGMLTSLLGMAPDALVIEASADPSSGVALCARTRAASPMPIALALWRNDDGKQQQEALKAGATTCLLLPLGANELVESIQRMLPRSPDPEEPPV